MHFQFSFKQMESSDALVNYAKEKITDKVAKFVNKPVEAHIVFSLDRHQHVAHCSLSGGDNFSLQVEHSCGDMYGSVDMMVDKLEIQLKRRKEKLKDHKNPKLRSVVAADGKTKDEFDAPVDAEDILKFEKVRGKVGIG